MIWIEPIKINVLFTNLTKNFDSLKIFTMAIINSYLSNRCQEVQV